MKKLFNTPKTKIFLYVGASILLIVLTILFYNLGKNSVENTGTPIGCPFPTHIDVEKYVTTTPVPTPPLTEIPTPTPNILAPSKLPENYYNAEEGYYFIKMGENIEYRFYPNIEDYEGCQLSVVGTGSTYDFESAQAFAEYLQAEMDWEDWRDAQYTIIDQVTRIIVEQNISRIGDYALANFMNANEIIFETTHMELGDSAFKNCGYNTIVYNQGLFTWVTFESVEHLTYHENAFQGCLILPYGIPAWNSITDIP